jgi:hypothetical protein
MATKLYYRNVTPALWSATRVFSVKDAARGVTPGSELYEGNTILQALNGTVGTGVGSTTTRNSVAGPTNGILVTNASGNTDCAISDPIAADITISGTVSFDMCGNESAMTANATFRMAVYRVDPQGALTLIVNSASATELGTTTTRLSWTATPTSTNLFIGDRILLIPMFDDAGGTMASGTLLVWRDNGSNADIADSAITFTENLTFITSDPAGTTFYLRDTASDVSSLKVLSLTQGAGTSEAVHTTIGGPIAFPGDQWTATAGGSDIGWITAGLNAFTLTGGVKIVLTNNDTALESPLASPFDAITLELAICDADGTNPVVWARSYTSNVDVTGGKVYYFTGPPTSVAQGKRLRFIPYSDDFRPKGDQVAGTNRTIRYDGTSTYASALTFTQTITEAATGTTFNQSVGGGFTPSASLLKTATKIVAAGITPAGVVVRSVARSVAGTINPAGAVLKSVNKTFAGTVTSTGVLAASRLTFRNNAGSITPTGTLLRQAQKLLSGTVAPVGALVRQARMNLVGTVTPSGALQRSTTKRLTGSVTPTGIVTAIKVVLSFLVGSVTPAGALLRSTVKLLSGVVTSAGALIRRAAKSVSGALVPTGALVRSVFKLLIAALTPTGALQRRMNKSFAATITPTGALFRSISKLLSGAVSSAGALVRTPRKLLIGIIGPTGMLATLGGNQLSLAGGIAPSGALVRRVTKLLTGALIPAGVLLRSVAKSLSGTVSSSGALVRSTTKRLSGTLTPSGALTAIGLKFAAVAGSVAPSGSLARAVAKSLAGALTATGTLTRSVTKSFAAAITPVGTLLAIFVKSVGGVLSLIGDLVTTFIATTIQLLYRVVDWSRSRFTLTDRSRSQLEVSDKSHSSHSVDERT